MKIKPNIIAIIPTGFGCEIGGHAGDATPAMRLLGAVSDRIVLHPNCVNASDINEMPENALYVDGYQLDEFIAGRIGLQERVGNKVLVAINPPITPHSINGVNAARATLGIEAEILELSTPLRMRSMIHNRIASGEFSGLNELLEDVKARDFDCLAVCTPISCDKRVAENYFANGGANPWGGIEAIVSREISRRLGDKPVAHAPVESGLFEDLKLVSDPRMSAEFVSVAYMFCVLKGLSVAPRLCEPSRLNMTIGDIAALVSPYMPLGEVHEEALSHGLEVIMVAENTTVLGPCEDEHRVTVVENYLEAAGYLACRSIGISPEAVRRPLESVDITCFDHTRYHRRRVPLNAT